MFFSTEAFLFSACFACIREGRATITGLARVGSGIVSLLGMDSNDVFRKS
jgi:hypothetical protein